jgi:hypothetical protein
MEVALLPEPQTKAEMIARYKAARANLNPKPQYLLRPDKAPPVVPPPEVVVDAPPLRPMARLLLSLGAWIVEKPPEPLIPYHLQNSVRRIQQLTAREMGTSVPDMVSNRRTARMALARQIAMWIAKEKTPNSYPSIGRSFGNRDHTTVMHAWRKIERLRHCDPEIAYHIHRIVAAL